ncbi:hypothetical protein AXJ14_gp074 [Geobacillus virus E3]|uniref:hypothetical protein n=1 Tax=Geobacillus virus E3 TaxID=1572712 RepID=UPI000671ABF6|nr:hypothetical protein AXJ14_gp074 [Geobacillus virus E3]AJA41393.1 hypothetical protein E3_074 [Geobacillus virus E3]
MLFMKKQTVTIDYETAKKLGELLEYFTDINKIKEIHRDDVVKMCIDLIHKKLIK